MHRLCIVVSGYRVPRVAEGTMSEAARPAKRARLGSAAPGREEANGPASKAPMGTTKLESKGTLKRSSKALAPVPLPPKRGRPWSGPHELWTTAAAVLAHVLRNGSLKSLLAPMRSEQAKPINALVTETLKRRDLLEKLVEECGPWREPKDARAEKGKEKAKGAKGAASPPRHELRLLLAYEMLFGHGLRQPALLRPSDDDALGEALSRMRAWEAATVKAAKAAKSSAGAAGGGADTSADEASDEAAVTSGAVGSGASVSGVTMGSEGEVAMPLPRYARVNTLKASAASVISCFVAEGWRLLTAPTDGVGGLAARPPPAATFWVDAHVPALLVFPPSTELHQHALVRASMLILQDKASCLAPAALAPRAGALVVDACAAPGNKTTQLAALAAPGGRVLACERDVRRASVLRARAAAAAGDAIDVRLVDFLDVDPRTAPWCDATCLQLDPTCSGSGMVERASYQLGTAGSAAGRAGAAGGRAPHLVELGALQLRLLTHGLSFPRASTLVYSTCSVHPAEDEAVVRAALADPAVQAAGWTLATALPAWPCRGLPLLPHREADKLVRAGPETQTNGFFVARFERQLSDRELPSRQAHPADDQADVPPHITDHCRPPTQPATSGRRPPATRRPRDKPPRRTKT